MKRKLSVLLSFVFITTLLLFCLPSCSSGTREYSSGAFRYTVENNEVTLTQYNGVEANVTIPESIDGMPVVAIGTRAFMDCITIKSVTIPDSVVNIEFGVFFRCTSLESVTLGRGTRVIDSSVFHHCSKIAYNEYENGYYLGNKENPYLALVYMASNVETATFHPDTVIICGDAFEDCSKLNELVIPEGVVSIGGFALPSLETVSIPASMEFIDSSAFDYCKTPTEITVAEDNPCYKSVGGSLFSHDGTRLIKYASGQTVESYRVPEGTVVIELAAFEEAKHLIEVVLPDSVEEIEHSAFLRCDRMQSIHLGNGLRRIGGQAFGFCTSLTEITIPDSVEELSYSVFSYCDKLESAVIGSGVIKMDTEVFDGCDALREVVFKDSEGWRVGTMFSLFTDKVDLSDPRQNAEYLTSEYRAYYWSKK